MAGSTDRLCHSARPEVRMTRRWIVSTATFVLIVAVLGGAMAFAGDAQALPSLDPRRARCG
jgi:hypothetical protein